MDIPNKYIFAILYFPIFFTPNTAILTFLYAWMESSKPIKSWIDFFHFHLEFFYFPIFRFYTIRLKMATSTSNVD